MIVNKIVDDAGDALSSECIRSECLTSLLKEFGIVVLRGFQDFKDEDDMINKYRKRVPRGLFEWEFGVIHKLKTVSETHDVTKSFESLPIHFDMMYLPKYVGADQANHRYEDYVCREFLLYCRESCEDEKVGQTTIIDAKAVALALDGEKIENWRNTIISYETFSTQNQESYFGGKGSHYDYPLVMQCPWTGNDVLRWSQRWNEDEHPSSKQVMTYEVLTSSDGEKITPLQLEEEIRKIALDERFYFGHSYTKGDQVYINNYTTLHGRKGSSNKRELWRIQAIPPSDNLPPYFIEHSQ